MRNKINKKGGLRSGSGRKPKPYNMVGIYIKVPEQKREELFKQFRELKFEAEQRLREENKI